MFLKFFAQFYCLVSCIGHAGADGEVSTFEDGSAFGFVGPRQADDDRNVCLDYLEGFEEPVGNVVTACDTTEDIDQHHLYVPVAQEKFHGLDNLLGVGTAADVKEVGRFAAIQLDHVHGRHGKSGTVHHTSDASAQVHVAESLVLGFTLLALLSGWLEELGNVRVAEEGIVVEGHFCIDGFQRHLFQ